MAMKFTAYPKVGDGGKELVKDGIHCHGLVDNSNFIKVIKDP